MVIHYEIDFSLLLAIIALIVAIISTVFMIYINKDK